MSEAVSVSALGGQIRQDGIAHVEEIGPVGMITVRADLSGSTFAKAIRAATGLGVPGQRKSVTKGDKTLCWMSPDELLVVCPHEEAAATVDALQTGFADTFAMAVNVSEARAVFRVSGDHARDVLAKLVPVDLAEGKFEPGDFRRTRMAQVAAAFRMTDEQSFEIICFRSVARYVFDLLNTAAQPGSTVGFHGKN